MGDFFCIEARQVIFCPGLSRHGSALNGTAADVLQPHLNTGAKETRARRKCPTPGSECDARRGPAPVMQGGGDDEAEPVDAMMDEQGGT